MAMTTEEAKGSAPAKANLRVVMDALVEKYGEPDPKGRPADESVKAAWTNPLGRKTTIMLSVNQSPPSNEQITVSYFFSNYAECLAEAKSGT
jgi:hypothetical protein